MLSANVTIRFSNAEEHELVVKLVEGLESTTFAHGFVFYTSFQWADKLTLGLSEDAQSKIDRYIGERGLSKFIAAEITQKLERLPTRVLIEKNDSASVIPFLRSPLPFAKELVHTLRKIPMRYQVTVALPSILAEYITDEAQNAISLPSGITIARGDSLPADLPVSNPFERVDCNLYTDFTYDEAVSRPFRSDLLYMSIPMIGYAYAREASALAHLAEDHLRAFYGAGIATGFLDYAWQGSKIEKEHPFILVHDAATRELLVTEAQEEELIERRGHCATAGFANRHKQDIWSAYQTIVLKIGTIYNTDIDCRKLFSACIWYYRAKINDRPLDALLQATIAIEVMLGDRRASEGIGLTNLLESRCAYLLGRSSSNRAKIAADFRRIYDLRSQVVHEGRHTLKTGDREIVNSARNLCAALISRELAIRAVDSEGSQ